MSIYPPTGTLEIKNATLKIPVVDLQYTSNTAKLEANSNVVTEFSRSKKLIKYPRVALTSAAQTELGYEGYFVSQDSATLNGTSNRQAWAFFDIEGSDGTSPASPHLISSTDRFDSNGNYTGGDSLANVSGDWIYIRLPDKIQLQSVALWARITNGRNPVDATVLGSLNGTNWSVLGSWTGATFTAGESSSFTINSIQYYDYIGFVFEKIEASSSGKYVNFHEIDLYGVPEYDPEAHGTDVTVKSYPNVPNTDFLDVFVDAGNASGFTLSGSDVTGVTDLSTPANTMTVNGNVTYNSANKAFVFPGTTSSYMRATLVDGNGNYPLTLSVWFMMTDYSGSWRNIITVGTSAVGEQASIGYDPNQDQLYFGTYSADIYVTHTPVLGKWYHVAATFTGGSTTSSTMNVYLNGVNMGGVPNGTQTPSFTNNQFVIGGAMNSNGTTVNNPFKGQVGNARFYRRTYTSDEIYQLYAYQKEDFGHGDLSMTLKAGRLGIGTSEPRAALDVRGDIKFSGRPNFTESLFFYTGNTPTNYYASTYKNRHGFYLNTLIPSNSHIGNYGTGGDNQVFTESSYGGSNELCGSHFDCMVYWLKNAPVGHVHRLNWCSNNGSGGSQTYGQKTSGTQIRLWGYWFHTGTYDRDWTGGVYFNISTSTVSVFYEGATFQ